MKTSLISRFTLCLFLTSSLLSVNVFADEMSAMVTVHLPGYATKTAAEYLHHLGEISEAVSELGSKEMGEYCSIVPLPNMTMVMGADILYEAELTCRSAAGEVDRNSLVLQEFLKDLKSQYQIDMQIIPPAGGGASVRN